MKESKYFKHNSPEGVIEVTFDIIDEGTKPYLIKNVRLFSMSKISLASFPDLEWINGEWVLCHNWERMDTNNRNIPQKIVYSDNVTAKVIVSEIIKMRDESGPIFLHF